jgi:hypothetical protein
MKLILALSLILNVALAGVLAVKFRPGTGEKAAPQTASAPAVPASPGATLTDAVRKNPAPAGDAAAVAFDWRKVESPDYREYIANLRAIGCPEKTLRDIIVADVNELFRQRARESGAGKRVEYWKPGNPLANLLDEDVVARQQELNKEKREVLKSLLGEGYSDQMDVASLSMANPLERMLDFLTPEKQTAALELEQKYAAKLMKNLKEIQRGDTDSMKKVMAEKDTEMLKILTPEEKFDYDLRLSQTATLMRMQMGDFEPTEQEFREMFKAQKKFDDEFGLPGLTGKTGDPTKRAEAQKELETEMKAALGEDRYRNLTYEKRLAYDPLATISKENNIPRTSVYKVLEMQTEAEAQAAQLRADKSMSSSQRQSTMTSMRQETEKAVGEILGATAGPAYINQAQWIKNLK